MRKCKRLEVASRDGVKSGVTRRWQRWKYSMANAKSTSMKERLLQVFLSLASHIRVRRLRRLPSRRRRTTKANTREERRAMTAKLPSLKNLRALVSVATIIEMMLEATARRLSKMSTSI